MPAPTSTVGIYLYDDVEVLDFAGPFEVFSVATRVSRRDAPSAPPPFVALTISRTGEPVTARGGLVVTPMHAIAGHPALDVLIIPGGVIDAEVSRTDVIGWIRAQATAARLVASVCTGAFLLAQAGLLKGRRATTHREDADDLAARHPDIKVERGVGWVDEGSIVTSAGISAGIDVSLHLVARLTGTDLATLTARQMEYHWHARP